MIRKLLILLAFLGFQINPLLAQLPEKWLQCKLALERQAYKTADDLLSSIENEQESLPAELQVQTWWITARVHAHWGRWHKAQNAYMRSFKRIPEKNKVQNALYKLILIDLASLYLEVDRNEAAVEILKKLQESGHIHCHNDPENYAQIEYLLGQSEISSCRFETAESYLNEANACVESSGKQKSKEAITTLILQGSLFTKQGSYTAAEAMLRKARFLLKNQSIEGNTLQIRYWLTYGELLIQLHNYKEALETFQLAKKNIQEWFSPQHPAYAKAQLGLCKTYIAAQKSIEVQANLEPLISTIQKLYGSKHTLTLEAKWLEAISASGQPAYLQRADSLFSKLLNRFEGIEDQPLLLAQSHLGWAKVLYSLGKYESSVDQYDRGLEIVKECFDNNHPLYIQTINDLAFVHWAMGNEGKAESYFDRSAQNYITQFNRYFAFLSEQEKGYFYQDIRQFFDRYNAFILKRASKHPALKSAMYNHQLVTKALLFHTSAEIRNQIVHTGDPKLISKYRTWLGYKEQLSKLYKWVNDNPSEENNSLLDSLSDKANDLEKELSLRIELLKGKKSNLQEVRWKDIHAALQKDQAAVEIIRVPVFKPDSGGKITSEVRYAALIVTPETSSEPILVQIEQGKLLETKYIKFYRNAIQLKLEDDISYDQFWNPIKQCKALDQVKKMFLSCDGVYNQINLNTLYHPETKKPVIDEVEIHLLSNTKDIIKHKAEEKSNPIVLFGFPDYEANSYNGNELNASQTAPTNLPLLKQKAGHHQRGESNFSDISAGGKIAPLPGTKTEVEEIEKVLQKEYTPQVYLDKRALEQHFKALESPLILHIATHGFFMPDQKNQKSELNQEAFQTLNQNPLTKSGVLLTGAGNAYAAETMEKEYKALREGKNHEDGILTAYEAMNLALNGTELVVLSACETGMGEVKNGEGVYGLQRALQTAGAKSVIMSLWKVSDVATKELMILFYREWLKTRNKRLAFQTAQNVLRKNYPEPIYWGAFVMIGDR